MMSGGKALICCGVSGLLLVPGAKANIGEPREYPYQGIVDRNIFALKPLPPPVRPEDIKSPVPDLNLTGITTILGKKQALLKVPAKPPKQPKEESYILAEGQSEGEIEVLTIDEVAATVKVNNHGTIQTLDFLNNGGKAAGGPAPGLPGVAPAGPGIMPSMKIPPPGAVGARQIPPQPLHAASESGFQPAAAAVPSAPPAYAGGAIPGNSGAMNLSLGAPPANPGRLEDTPQFRTGLTAEEQTILIEEQRARLLDAGNIEDANMYPPTELTPQITQ
jgi:hypothetical protein